MTEADYLRAIHESPDDMALRAVYGDMLQQRGDPRGEFIAIQLAHLAGRVSAKSRLRERELLVGRHIRAWMGEMARWFYDVHSSVPVVFEGGFFVGGGLRQLTVDELAHALDAEPAWRLVHTFVEPSLEACALVDDPRFRRIRALTSISSAALLAVLRGPVKPSLVDVELHGDPDPDLAELLATCVALPNLRSLAVARLDASAPIIERLERLRARVDLGALAGRGGTLRVVELALGVFSDPARRWRIEVRRETAPGPFTSLVASHASPSTTTGKKLGPEIASILGAVPPAWLRTLEIDLDRVVEFPPAVMAELAETVGEMTNLERVAVPWAVGPRSAAIAGAHYAGGTSGGDLFPRIPEVWAAFVDDLGQRFDCYSVNDRGSPALGKTPVAALLKRAAAPQTESLSLRRDGYREVLTMSRASGYFHSQFEITSDRATSALIAWFVRALEIASFDTAHLALAGQRYDYGAFQLGPHERLWPGWLVALGPRFRRWLPNAAIAARGLRVEPARDHLVIVVAEPAELSLAHLRAVAEPLIDIIDAEVHTRLSLDFPRHATEAFARFGRIPTRTTPTCVEYGWVRIELGGVLDDRLSVHVRAGGGDVGSARISQREPLVVALATVAAEVQRRGDTLTW